MPHTTFEAFGKLSGVRLPLGEHFVDQQAYGVGMSSPPEDFDNATAALSAVAGVFGTDSDQSVQALKGFIARTKDTTPPEDEEES